MLNLIELQPGSQATLVLIHGTAGSPRSSWQGLMGHVAGDVRVLACDLSRLECLSVGERTGECLGRWLAGQIGVVAGHGAHLVGFSLGAALAMEVAAVFPHLVLSLTLIAPFDNARHPRVRDTFERWRHLLAHNPRDLAGEIIRQGFSAAYMQSLTPAQVADCIDDFFRRVHWPAVTAQVALNLSLDIASKVRRVGCPTAVIAAEHDQWIPTTVSRSLYRRLRDGYWFVLPCGHLVTAEAPQALAWIIQDFIARSVAHA